MSRHLTARVLVYTHRWMGIALGVLFVIWFASGIVMMYARMPELQTSERLARLQAIDPDSVRVSPPIAADTEITRLVINTIEMRPVYRITAQGQTQVIFADTGEAVPKIDAQHALLIGNAFHHGTFTLRYDQNPAPLPIPSGSPAGSVFAAGFVPFAEKTDTLTDLSLIYTFL